MMKNFKVSRRNYCNYYNLPIYLRDLSSKLSEMPKAEESLCGNKIKNMNKKISSPLHPFGRFVGASSKLSGREHGLITLVPAQWELIFYNCDGLHILQIGIHVMYERVGVLERENTVFPMNCVLSFTQIRYKFR